MSAQTIAEKADMIVAGYAYTIYEDYIEVIDLSDLTKRAILQNDDVVESMMSDEEDDVILNYYLRNAALLEAQYLEVSQVGGLLGITPVPYAV